MVEKKSTLTSRVAELESSLIEMESRTNSLKEAVVETNKNFTDALRKVAELLASHELVPDAHNSSVVWQRRNEIEKGKKIATAG